MSYKYNGHDQIRARVLKKRRRIASIVAAVLALIVAWGVYSTISDRHASLLQRIGEIGYRDSIDAAERQRSGALARYNDSVRTTFYSPDLAFNQLHGRVKSVTSGHVTLDFNDDGGWINIPDSYHRDADGYIATEHMRASDGENIVVTYQWAGSRLGRVANGTVVQDYHYDARGVIDSIIVIIGPCNFAPRGGKALYVYSDYEFDAVGNWTHRRLNIREDIVGEAPTHQTSEELRKITYYDTTE